ISILFGHLCAALCVMNATFAAHERHSARWFALAGSIGALCAVLLSATRGAVLTLLVLGGIGVLAWCRAHARRWLAIAAAFAVLVAVVALTPLGRGTLERIAEGYAELRAHRVAETALERREVPALPACLDNAAFARAVLASGALRFHGDATAAVIPAGPAFAALDAPDCSGSGVLRISSTGKKTPHVVLPVRNVSPDVSVDARIVVRGEGAVRLLGNGRYRVAVAWDEPRLITLDGTKAPTGAVVIMPAPGRSIDVALV